MFSRSTLMLCFALSSSTAVLADRTFKVKNNCKFTIWPAMYTDPNVGKALPKQKTGWEQKAGAEVTFKVPDDWKAGRLWGRTDCDFKKDGLSACSSGNCNGGLECAKAGGTGVPPVTVAEWTLGDDKAPDNYDVSLVDGFNLPMSVTSDKGCHEASCPADLNPKCPDKLQLKGPKGTVGCKSACSANLDGKAEDSPNCCSGSHDKPETCPPSGVQFYDFFKKPCVNAYAYAYDESSKTALWTCDTAKKTNYNVVFCP